MKNEQNLKSPVASFILLTNIIFIPLFLLTGMTLMLGLPTIVFDMMLCIASWSSTFAFLILFKRLHLGQNLTTYIKGKLSNKINWKIVGLIVLIQTIIFIGVTYAVGSRNNIEGSIFTVSSMSMLVYYFLKNLLAGPLGEELGWRGFAQEELQKKHSPLKAAIIIGFWWGIWHMPIWFTTGFWGETLMLYILLFMISVIAISIIMAAFYNLNKNLIIPIIIHQLFNVFIGLVNGNIVKVVGYSAVCYGIVAIGLVIINPKQSLYIKEEV
ncbi:MAG: type II CAAX endopeptidase family protein [Cellulosilyticaceae bacterium]